ncbi:hypothetical protein L3X38_019355 [Prunus dulcis]|uniref:Uncharacterized protein n=1 Tax=Prunus dulcis TaxID=3755 RepID=A0AAD4WDC5_PRUDU|nr:hypothetical protein L3X38_019355 [Prunus dulcis]
MLHPCIKLFLVEVWRVVGLPRKVSALSHADVMPWLVGNLGAKAFWGADISWHTVELAWVHPGIGAFKLNVDGTCKPWSGAIGAGGVIHDSMGDWEAFWELTGFEFVGTPKLSELEAGAIPGWVTTLGSCFVSSQKQNRAGWNSEVKRVGGWSNPRMGDHPGKLLRELPETKP